MAYLTECVTEYPIMLLYQMPMLIHSNLYLDLAYYDPCPKYGGTMPSDSGFKTTFHVAIRAYIVYGTF